MTNTVLLITVYTEATERIPMDQLTKSSLGVLGSSLRLLLLHLPFCFALSFIEPEFFESLWCLLPAWECCFDSTGVTDNVLCVATRLTYIASWRRGRCLSKQGSSTCRAGVRVLGCWRDNRYLSLERGRGGVASGQSSKWSLHLRKSCLCFEIRGKKFCY